MNTKKLFTIDPYYLDIAKAVYRRGEFKNSSNSAFIRAVLEDISKRVLKGGKK